MKKEPLIPSITREQQQQKYEHDEKYHASCDDYSQAVYNRYSIRHYYGRHFEHQKVSTIISFLNKGEILLGNKKIIDIGCHRGRITALWSELKGESKDVYGADFINDFIATAKRINPGVSFLQHDVYDDLPFKNGFFDIISIVYVYACIPPEDQVEISSKLLKKLKTDGYLILLDFNDSLAVRIRQKIITILRKAVGKKSKTYLPRLNNKKIKRLFPSCEIVATRKFMNMFSYRLLKISPLLASIADLFLPGEYFAVMLKNK